MREERTRLLAARRRAEATFAVTSLPSSRLDLELKDHEGSTALWLAVQYVTVSPDHSVNPFEDLPVLNGTSFDENSFAARLIQRGSNTNAPDAATGRAWAPGLGSGLEGPRGVTPALPPETEQPNGVLVRVRLCLQPQQRPRLFSCHLML